jgi:hypothetical protein
MEAGNRSLYINAALLAGVLVLAAALWLAPAPDAELKPFAHINPDAIDRIEIIVPQQPPALLQRVDGEWRVPGDTSARLDPQRLRNLLNILNVSVDQEYTATDLKLWEFGLEPAAAILKLNDHSLHFGGIEVLSQRRYVLYQAKLYLLADTHYPLLSRGIGNLLAEQAPAVPATTDAMPELPAFETTH